MIINKHKLETDNSPPRKVTIKQGVRQGCILSPILFNMHNEEVIKNLI